MTGLKPYLARSAGFHASALAAFLLLAPRGLLKSDKVYMIDFVGPSSSILSAGLEGGKPAAASAPAPRARISPQSDPDALSIKNRRSRAVLPRPSLLRGWTEEQVKAPPQPSLSPAPGPAASVGGGEAGSGTPGSSAGVATDMPNFPYPWYISQIRLMLWQAWQRRMPRAAGEGVVTFSIMRGGGCTDLRMESSSGDSEFDQAALESVQAAAPFPALPSDFSERFLKIHLTLKSEAP